MISYPAPALKSRRGFTLLELLVAIAVGAIVLLVISGTFFGAIRLSNTTHDRIASDLELQRTLGIVRKDFAGIMLSGGVLAGQFQTTVASSLTQGTYGDQVGPDLYTNTGTVDGWGPFSEVQLVEYYLSPKADGGNGRSLVRVVTRNLLPVQTTTPDVQTLLSGISNATIDYYDGSQWTDTWDSSATTTLPKAIRFQIVLAGANSSRSNQQPIELVVPVLVSTPASQLQSITDGTGS